MFDNRVLRNIFRHNREDVTGVWRTLHNEEKHDFCCSDVIRINESRRRRWMPHVCHVWGELRCVQDEGM